MVDLDKGALVEAWAVFSRPSGRGYNPGMYDRFAAGVEEYLKSAERREEGKRLAEPIEGDVITPGEAIDRMKVEDAGSLDDHRARRFVDRYGGEGAI